MSENVLWGRVTVVFSVLALLVVVLAIAPGAVAANDEPVNLDASDLEGDGDEESPYLITNASELQAMEDDLGAHYRLDENIDASETEEWNGGDGFDPVGVLSYQGGSAFEGEFDGDGHEIRGLTVDRDTSEDGEGLFGATYGATITNVALVDVDIDGGAYTGRGYTGGLVGYGDGGEVSEVTVSGDVTGDGPGGIIGYSYLSVSNVSVTANVTGDLNAAGIAGGQGNSGSVHDAYVAGEITGGSGDYDDVGGVLGYQGGGSVDDAYWDEETTGTDSGIGRDDGGSGDTTELTTDEMTGGDAESNMFSFGETWETVGASDDDATNNGYPVLSSVNRQSQLEGQNVNAYEPIQDWHDLDDVRDDLGGDYVLVTDLDEDTPGYDTVAGEHADGGAGFDPISGSGASFTGTFDGNGNGISDLYISREDTSYIGLFGYLGTDGTVENVDILGADVTGNDNVGGLVGSNFAGEVRGSSVAGAVVGTVWVGGLVGSNGLNGDVSESDASVAVEGNERVGGLIGHNSNEARESYATGDVIGELRTGGLIGRNDGTLQGAYATGDVKSGGDAGGLVGYNFDADVTESYATGEVDGGGDAGGLVGYNFKAGVTDSYWDRDTTGVDSGIGTNNDGTDDTTGLTTDEMTGADAETNMFSFGETWETVEASDDGYPVLAWEDREEPTVTTFDADDETVTAGETGDLTVTAETENGNAGEGVTVEVSDADGLSSVETGDTATTDKNGDATFELDEEDAGQYAPEFAWADDSDVTTTADVMVEPGSADSVTVDSQPDGAQIAGESLTGTPAVLVTDEYDNPVPEVDVIAAVTGFSGSITAGETTVTTNDDGEAAFDNLVLEEADDGYRLKFAIDDEQSTVGSSDMSETDAFDVAAGDVDSLDVIDAPDSIDAGDEADLAIETNDAYGNPTVDQDIESVEVQSPHDGTVANFDTTTLDENGQATISIGREELVTADDDHEVTVRGDGVTSSTTSLAVAPSTPNHVRFDQQPHDVTAGDPVTGENGEDVTVEIFDIYGNFVDDADDEVDLEVADGDGNLAGATTVRADDGVVTFDAVVIDTAGEYTLGAGSDELSSVTSETFTVSTGAADTMEIDGQLDSSQVAGDIITGVPTVKVRDAYGNAISDVTVSVDGPLAAGTETQQTNSDGEAVFDDLVIESSGTYDLTFESTDGAGTVTTDTLTVEPSDADAVEIDANPDGTQIAGEPITGPPAVTVTDEYDNPVADESVAVEATGGDESITGGTMTVETDEDGIAIFDGLDIRAADDTYHLEFTINGGQATVESDQFTVNPAAVDTLEVNDTPSTIDAGKETTLTVEATDAYGNPATDQDLSNVEIASSEDGVVYDANRDSLDSDGNFEATISADELTTAVDATLTVRSDETGATSVDVTVEPSEASNAVFDQQPDDGTAGEPITDDNGDDVTVELLDEYGNRVDNADDEVDLKVADSGGNINGETTVRTDDGIATFDDIAIDTVDDYSLKATSNGLAGATSDTFTVSPSAADTMEVDTQPDPSQGAGDTISGEPTVIVRDAYDNAISDITVSVNGPLAAGTETQQTNSDGEAVFDDLVIESTGTYELTFESTGDTEDVTTAFAVEPSNAESIMVDADPDSTQTAGEPITGPPTITVTDEYDNPVADEPVAVDAIGGNGAIERGKTIVETNEDGNAVFDALEIWNVDDGYRLEFSASDDQATVESDQFTVEPAAVDTFEISDMPSTIEAGEKTTLTVEAIDEYDNPAAGDELTSFEIESTEDGVVYDANTESLDANGKFDVTISAGKLTTAANVTTLAATSDETESATVNVTVEPNDGDSIAVATQPRDTDEDEQIGGPPAATVTDEFENVVPETNVTVSVTGSFDSGTETNTTNASGVVVFDDLVIDSPGTYDLTFDAAGVESNATTDTFTVESTSDDSSSDDDEPEVFTDPDKIADEFDLPDGADATYAETVSPETVDGNTIVEFTDDSPVKQINSTGDSNDEIGVVQLNTSQIGSDGPPGEAVNTSDVFVPDDLENATATIQYRLTTDHLNTSGTPNEDLSLYRQSNDEWESLETSVVNESNDEITFEAETPGFSVIAVSATSEPDPVVTDLPESVAAGSVVTLDASNSTTEYGSITAYEWNLDGETLTGKTIDVILDEPGTHTVELAVTNDAGSIATITQDVAVEEDETDTSDTSTSDPDGVSANETDTSTDDATPGLGFAAAVAALLGIAVGLARQ